MEPSSNLRARGSGSIRALSGQERREDYFEGMARVKSASPLTPVAGSLEIRALEPLVNCDIGTWMVWSAAYPRFQLPLQRLSSLASQVK